MPHQIWNIYIFLIIQVFLIAETISQSTVDIYSAGFNYFADIEIGGKLFRAIIDTGDPSLTVIGNSSHFTNDLVSKTTYCLFLYEDGTQISLAKVGSRGQLYPYACSLHENIVTLSETSKAFVNYTLAPQLEIQNLRLHNWTHADGDIGLAYCDTTLGTCSLTAFQELIVNSTKMQYQSAAPFPDSTLINSSSPMLFGLDFNPPYLSIKSSMQIGFVEEKYQQNISWYQQATVNPTYHTIFVQNLQFCGIDLMTNWSTNWPVLIDTGSVCVTLPFEIYTTFTAWLNTSSISSGNELPALTFQINGGSETLFIPLANLLINASFIETEIGAPLILVGNQQQRLCILQGSPINTQGSQLNTPLIVFGSLALRSLYFAADFSTGSVGFASKLTSAEATRYSSKDSHLQCQAKTVCKGDANFECDTNSCREPTCGHYFFVDVDKATQTCVYQESAMVWGLLIVVLAAFLEAVSFFIFQRTAFDYITRTQSRREPNEDRVAYSQLDPISHVVGGWCNAAIDYLLINVLR